MDISCYSSCISGCEVFLEEKPEYYSAKMYFQYILCASRSVLLVTA